MPCPRCSTQPLAQGVGGAFFPLVGIPAGPRARDPLLTIITFEPAEGTDPELQKWGPVKICAGCGVLFAERKRTTPPPAR